jgi:LmbE family N-acetylglucosaminyl deacetylase
MRTIRIDEERRAAELGEYSAAVLLDYASDKPKDPTAREVVDDLAALVRATEPDVVYTHSLADAHDTHVAVALRTIDALQSLPSETRPLRVYGCEVWRDLDWLIEPDKVVLSDDVGDDHLLEMLEMYESQLVAKRFDTATIGRRRAHATFGHSHRTDEHRSATLAMDLTPLIHEPNLGPDDLVLDAIERLRSDVLERINRLRTVR